MQTRKQAVIACTCAAFFGLVLASVGFSPDADAKEKSQSQPPPENSEKKPEPAVPPAPPKQESAADKSKPKAKEGEACAKTTDCDKSGSELVCQSDGKAKKCVHAPSKPAQIKVT